jgi:type II secretory pathway predicted ATPase ExeA
MTTTYQTFFSLSAPPFQKGVCEGELYRPSNSLLLQAQLIAAIRQHQQIALYGEPGAGKTCLLRAVRHELPQDQFRLTYCANVTLGRRDFYRQFALALGIPPCGTAAALFNSISTQVQDLSHNRIHPVLILDEAHLLHQDTLDHLHILLNFDWDSRPLLSLLLVGLPDLRDRLLLRRNRSLLSRIHHRLALPPCTCTDTAEYLRHRLLRVGCDKELFAPDAVTLLHDSTQGALREIDRLATWALCCATVKKRHLVDRELMAQAIDSEQSPPSFC